MRLFIAVPVIGEFLERTLAVQERLKRVDADVKWVARQNMHFTLHFLGETAPERAEKLKEILNCAAGTAEFKISLGPAGAFPSIEDPRVIWLGIGQGSRELCGLAGIIGSGLSAAGFTLDSRPFSPHLTIGRTRGRGGLKQLTKSLAGLQAIEPVEMPVGSVHLIESRLSPQGPSYQSIFSLELKS